MLRLAPISFKEACAFVSANHRHHAAPRGHRFSLAAYIGNRLVGVAIVGRPTSRCVDRHRFCEVTRLCTDGSRNACSFLYGAARRAVAALGYERLLTYTLPEEGGASLRAAGFQHMGQTRGGSWDTPSRPRVDRAPTIPKDRWEIAA